MVQSSLRLAYVLLLSAEGVRVWGMVSYSWSVGALGVLGKQVLVDIA